MEKIFSRLAATPGLKQVFAVIEVVNNTLPLYARLPVTIATKINAAFKSAVEFVLLRSDVAEIAPSVVGPIPVDMVNLNGLLSGHQKVSDTVGVINRPFVAKPSVTSASTSPNPTKKLSGIGVVNNLVANSFWYKFLSHSDTSYVGLVRGLVTAITSTPILSRRYSHV